MFMLIKKFFIVLLTSIASAANHTKCLSLRNQKCKIQPTLINLRPNEYSRELNYISFVVTSDTRVWSCNTLKELSKYVFQTKEKI